MSYSCGHKIQRIEGERYLLVWVTVITLDGGGRMAPRLCSRETDRAGAERYAKRWGCPGPHEGMQKTKRAGLSAGSSRAPHKGTTSAVADCEQPTTGERPAVVTDEQGRSQAVARRVTGCDLALAAMVATGSTR